MTFLEVFLPSFKRHLSYGRFFKCLFFEWDKKQGQIIVNKATPRKASVHIWTILNGIYVAFQIGRLILERHTLADSFISMLISAGYWFWFMVRIDIEPDLTAMLNLNRLISGIGKQVLLKLYLQEKRF